MSWSERAADRSPLVQRWRSRSMQQTRVMVDAAKRLINEKGTKFTTQELAQEAGVGIQTFYRYFGGKDQLMLAAIEDILAEQAVEFEQAARELPGPLARLHYYVRAVLSNLEREGRSAEVPRLVVAELLRLHQVYPEEMGHVAQPFQDLLARELRACQEAGLLAPGDADRGAEYMVIFIRSVYHHYAFAARKEPTGVIADRVWEFCLTGIGGTGGIGGIGGTASQRPGGEDRTA
jgi:AcrR family transcriptional regulator